MNAFSATPAPTATDGRLDLDALRLLETRLLVKRERGWEAVSYVWDDDQRDAVLKRTGEIIPLDLVSSDGARVRFSYLVPNINQCAGCHGVVGGQKSIEPIGPKFRHLQKASTFTVGVNQLDDWVDKGILDAEFSLSNANVDWSDPDQALEARARAYLDINCSHCHNAVGPADTSGLDLEPAAEGPALGFCKPPIAAGGGSGGRPYDIVPGAPEHSIMVFRMETTEPDKMMPELGRALAHDEGVALIAEWIRAMDGDCA